MVVLFAGLQDLPCVTPIHDQDVVEEFASEGADDSFAVGVHPGRPWRTPEHAQIVGVEDGVEGRAVFGVAVAEQEARGFDAGAEVGGEVSAFAPPGRAHRLR